MQEGPFGMKNIGPKVSAPWRDQPILWVAALSGVLALCLYVFYLICYLVGQCASCPFCP